MMEVLPSAQGDRGMPMPEVQCVPQWGKANGMDLWWVPGSTLRDVLS